MLKQKFNQLLNWFSRFLNRQTWVITGFSLIGAGYVLSLSFGVFWGEINTNLKQIYGGKTVIIIGAGADVALAKSPDVSDKGGSLTIEDRIRKEAERLGFAEIDKLVAIAKCESSLKPECEILNHEACVNPKNNSYDRGFFQVSRKYHPNVNDECAFDLECAVKSAIEIQKKSGWNAWVCNSL